MQFLERHTYTWPWINITWLLLNPYYFLKKCYSVLFQQYTMWHHLEVLLVKVDDVFEENGTFLDV